MESRVSRSRDPWLREEPGQPIRLARAKTTRAALFFPSNSCILSPKLGRDDDSKAVLRPSGLIVIHSSTKYECGLIHV